MNSNDILNFKKCVELINKLDSAHSFNENNDSDIMQSFIKEIGNYKDIEIYFTQYVNNYQELKNLSCYYLDKSEFSKHKIALICHKSTFILKNIKNEFFNGYYYNEEKKSKENQKQDKNVNQNKKKNIEAKIDMISLLELRNRALLTKIVRDDEEEKKNLESNKNFIEKVKEICNIHDLLHQIYMIGYPEEINIQMHINDFRSNFSGLGKNYHDIISKLEIILNEFKKAQLNAYKEKPLIRFVYGRQFNLIYNYLVKRIEIKKISPFLKFWTNNLIKEEIVDFKYQSTDNLYEDLFNNIEKYLENILLKNDLNLEEIFKDSLIKSIREDYNFKGVYLYLCNQVNKIDKDLFHIYKYLTGSIPASQNVLLCSKETTNEELVSFLFRAILSEFNSCFIIRGIELLEIDKKYKLLEILNLLLSKNYYKMKSCLIFLHTSKNTDIYKSLNSLKYKKILNLPKLNEILEINDDKSKIEIISSDNSGVGKSTNIKLQIKSQNKNYIYFPFGGKFKKEEIVQRLNNLAINNDSIIHFDLYDSDQTAQMMEFLFSILITKFYGQNEDIFYLPKEVGIKMEIQNGFIDIINEFPILKLFNNNKLLIEKLPPLIVPKNFLSDNIQFVANYIKAFNENKIDKTDIYFDKISPEDFSRFNTKEIAQILRQKECQELIFEEIKRKIDFPNYYQITSFIEVLAAQLKKFNQNFYLNANIINMFYNRKSWKIRSFIVESFIKIAKHFTEGALYKLVKIKKIHKEIEDGIEDLSNNNHSIVSFNNIAPFLLFFHEGNSQLFSVITNTSSNDIKFKELFKLKNYQDYQSYTHLQFLHELKDILDVRNPVKKIDARDGEISLEEIAGNYIFTEDNFVKMILILLKIRANIPVIMMGETGCGKTLLIKKLSEMLNNGKCKIKIKNIHPGISDKDIINFINNEVINEAKSLEKEENKKKYEYENNIENYIPRKLWVFFDNFNTCNSMGLIKELICQKSYQGKKLPNNIVFIAACNPFRFREIVDPDANQNYKEIKNLNQKSIKKMTNNSLVYKVNPLPDSLLNFVFDFGNLTPQDEMKYIKNIISESIERVFKSSKDKNINKKDNKKIEENFKNIHNLAKKMISKAQEFIRNRNGISSVSLREIRRFSILFEFFYGYLKNKKEINLNIIEKNKIFEEDNKFYNNLNEIEFVIYSIILGVFACYYLRILDKKERNEFRHIMNEILREFDSSFENKDFLDIPQKEELYIINNIELEKGIAKNRALLDNIFSLFIAINNKIPIFIVGKPGCSKHLSVQLIIKAMKGNSSNNLLFKQFPKIILYSYKGSMNNTSQGLEKVFKKARKTFENLSLEDKKNNIITIIFDKMGLADHSPNNPLEIINSELEHDLNEGNNKIAFVGISNWALDDSKMNCGLYLSMLEPEEEDIKNTALTIGKSYDYRLGELNKTLFENLGLIYSKYKNHLSSKYYDDKKKEFHGNRDFYYLIKNIARNILVKSKEGKISTEVLLEISISNIERNFGGLQFNDVNKANSLQVIKSIFSEFYPNYKLNNKFGVLKRIEENILDLNSRYLIIISKFSVSSLLLTSILSSLNKNYSLYIGSQFPNDIINEEYYLKILNKIQIHMKQGNILVLKNLEFVYPSLYDLFDFSQKNCTYISSPTNIFSLVNDNFRCIVNVDYNQIDKEESDFINRFEKQIISFDYLLDEKLLKESIRIYRILMDLVIYDKLIFKGINYDLKKIFVNFDLEEIQGIMYQASKTSNKSIPCIIDEVISKIALTLPQDIIICLKFNGFQLKYPDITKKIIKSYNCGKHNNLNGFLKTMSNRRNIIYTFSDNLDIIKISENINNEVFGNIISNNIFEIKISSIKSENEFERKIDNFYNDKEKKICLIRFNSNEGSFINYIKFFIENKEKALLSSKNENEINSEKIFIFIVHLIRIFNQDSSNEKPLSYEEEEINNKILKETISHTSEYYQIFIDNLNGNLEYSIDKIMSMNKRELFKRCLNLDEELINSMYLTISYMDYNISSEVYNLNEETYVNELMDYITKEKSLRNLINECLLKEVSDGEDFMKEILKKKGAVNQSDIDILSIIQRNLSKLYIKLLNVFYYRAEKDHFFSSLLSSYEENKNKICVNDSQINIVIENITESKNLLEDNKNNELIKNIMEVTKYAYLKNLKFNNGLLRFEEKIKKNRIEIILGLKLPGLKKNIELIVQKLRDENIKNYKRNEKNGIIANDKEHKHIYFFNLKRYNESTLNEILNEDIFNKISKEIDENLFYDLLLEDYYTIFIAKNFKIIKRKDSKKKNDDKNGFNFNLLKKFLKLLISLRRDEGKGMEKANGLEFLANTINWVESYSVEIINILIIISKLNTIADNLFDKIKIITAIYEKHDYKGDNTILNMIEFILKIVTSNEQIWINKENNKNELQLISYF